MAASLIEDADAGDAAVADCEAVLSDTGVGAARLFEVVDDGVCDDGLASPLSERAA